MATLFKSRFYLKVTEDLTLSLRKTVLTKDGSLIKEKKAHKLHANRIQGTTFQSVFNIWNNSSVVSPCSEFVVINAYKRLYRDEIEVIVLVHNLQVEVLCYIYSQTEIKK